MECLAQISIRLGFEVACHGMPWRLFSPVLCDAMGMLFTHRTHILKLHVSVNHLEETSVDQV